MPLPPNKTLTSPPRARDDPVSPLSLLSLLLHHSLASLPQKDAAGNPRTPEEEAAFQRGLPVMGACYASVAGTAVLQQRTIDIPPGVDDLGKYNRAPYDGEGGRGWCIFEQAVCMTVLAHLTKAKKRAAEQGGVALTERLARAEAARPKVIDISISLAEAVPRTCQRPPKEVLEEACQAIERAHFSKEEDKQVVPQMLNEFEWTVRRAFVVAYEDNARSGATVRPKTANALLRRVLTFRAPPSALLASQDPPHVSHIELQIARGAGDGVGDGR